MKDNWGARLGFSMFDFTSKIEIGEENCNLP
jgi:hypothetical protein